MAKPVAEHGKPSAELQQLVADADTGGRAAAGIAGKVIFAVAVAWSLFQLWYASPLPFEIGWGVLNDTEARAIHLGLGLFLAFAVFRCSSPRRAARFPFYDWMLAIAGAFAGAYLFLFYNELATRPGIPSLQDIIVASVGIVLLLEATRRAVGLPMMILALLFLAYIIRALPARRARAQGRLARSHAVAPVAHHRGRVRRRARRLGQLHLPVSCCSARCSTAPAPATT